MRAAIYARVSTFDQEPENQLAELRRYAEARGWTMQEYVDRGVSGAKDRRPALDTLVRMPPPPVRRGRVLAAGSSRPEPQTPHDAARGPAGARRRVRQPRRRASTPPRRPASCRCTSWPRSPSLVRVEPEVLLALTVPPCHADSRLRGIRLFDLNLR